MKRIIDADCAEQNPLPKGCISLLDIVNIGKEAEEECKKALDECVNDSIKVIEYYGKKYIIKLKDYILLSLDNDYFLMEIIDANTKIVYSTVFLNKIDDEIVFKAREIFSDQKLINQMISSMGENYISDSFNKMRTVLKKNKQYKTNIKSVNTFFNVAVGMNRVCFYTNSMNPYDLDNFVFEYSNGKYSSNDSIFRHTYGCASFEEVLNDKNFGYLVDEDMESFYVNYNFSIIYVKVEDCPQYVQDAAEKRKSKVNEPRRRLTLIK